MGNMIPLTPMSRATLTATRSFQGTRNMGTVGLPFIACSINCTSFIPAAACSPSMISQSNPALAMSSAAEGLPKSSQPPSETCPARNFALTALVIMFSPYLETGPNTKTPREDTETR